MMFSSCGASLILRQEMIPEVTIKRTSTNVDVVILSFAKITIILKGYKKHLLGVMNME